MTLKSIIYYRKGIYIYSSTSTTNSILIQIAEYKEITNLLLFYIFHYTIVNSEKLPFNAYFVEFCKTNVVGIYNT